MYALVLVLSSLLRAPDASASDDPTSALELTWQVPPGCPEAKALRERVASLLRSVDARGAARALKVRGRITEDAQDGVRLRLELAGGDAIDARELVGSDCREVTEAAALIVAMTLEPGVLDTLGHPVPAPQPAPEQPAPEQPAPEQPAPEQPEPEPDTTEPDTTEPDAIPEPDAAGPDAAEPTPVSREAARVQSSATSERAPTRARVPLAIGAELEGGVGLGPLPGASGVIAGAVGLRLPWSRVDATAAWWTPRRSEAREPGVRAQLWSLGARACGVPGTARVEVPLCVGVAAGLMHARGLGRELEAATARSPWAAAIASATAVVRLLPWLGVRIGAEGHLAFARPAFHTEPSGTRVHRAGLGGVAFRAGLELKFEVP